MTIFVVAEIGINHNGDIDIAKKLIDVAVDAGADAVKFQKRTINAVYDSTLLDSPRESPWGKTQRQQKEGLEFGEQEYSVIDQYCKAKNILWSASAWDVGSQEFLRKYELQFNKIASAMIVDSALLNMVASERKRTFISTGMSTLDDIDNAVEIFKSHKCPFELMHCVSTYPMPDGDANLRVISGLRERYGCAIGYSGHESGLAISYAAATLGISSLERHITLDRSMYGSDQAASLEPVPFKVLIGGIRKIESAMGDGIKKVSDAEHAVATKLRGHLDWGGK